METPEQIQRRANQMVAQQMMAQQTLIRGDYEDRMRQAMAQQLASEQAGRAAAAMNAQLMGLVGSGYSGAADEVRALGGSLGAAIGGANAADVAAAGATAGNVGAPAPSVGGGSPIAGPSQQGVEVFRGATLPAEALGTAGTSAQVGLGGLISAQNLRATQEAQAAYMQALGEANQARTTSIRDLISQRPTAYSSIYDKLMSANQNMAQLYQQAQYRNAQIANARAQIRQRYIIARSQAQTAAQKLQVDRWYKQQEASLRSQQIGIGQYNAQTGRMRANPQARLGAYNAQTGRMRAQTSARSAASRTAGPAPANGRDPTYAGRSMQAIVGNVAADYSKRYPNIRYDPETAFAWAWPRIRGYFPKSMRSQAQKYLRARLKALKPKSGSTTTVVGGTGWKSPGGG